MDLNRWIGHTPDVSGSGDSATSTMIELAKQQDMLIQSFQIKMMLINCIPSFVFCICLLLLGFLYLKYK